MRKALFAGMAVLALSGCGASRGIFGRSGPDEYQVARSAPLVVPPDFALVPPKPGAARPQDTDVQAQALQALFGGPAPRSVAESATLNAANNARADGGIRSSVGDPGTSVVDKGAVTRDIIAAPQGDGQGARASATPATTPAQTPPK
jgi:hypothetical protein